jgi:hypothetical protein
VGTAYGMEFIRRTLKAASVDEWEKLKGRTIYVLTEDDGWNSRVIGIGPLETEGTEKDNFIFDDLNLQFQN